MHQNDVVLKWNGAAYPVAPDQIISLIARIEDVLTLFELQQMALRGTLPQGKIAKAYTIALNFAGCPVTESEVYYGMFPQNEEEENSDEMATAAHVVRGLMALMMPPKKLQGKLAPSGNSEAPRTSGGKSKKRSKRSSHGTHKTHRHQRGFGS